MSSRRPTVAVRAVQQRNPLLLVHLGDDVLGVQTASAEVPPGRDVLESGSGLDALDALRDVSAVGERGARRAQRVRRARRARGRGEGE